MSEVLPEHIFNEVQKRLDHIEKEHDVHIVYALESGSRAWGFHSPDSDFDVRFLYVRKLNDYLALKKPRDVIETVIDKTWDIGGWDLQKGLALMRSSNPPMLEWLQSPLVYRDDARVMDPVRALLPLAYSQLSCHHHYWSMARRTMKEHLQGESVRLKKYFYALRPLLCCLYIQLDRGVMPIEFQTLLDAVPLDDDVKEAIEELREKKAKAMEGDTHAHLPVLDRFIEQTLERLSEERPPKNKAEDFAPFDVVFRNAISVDSEIL